MEDIKHVTDMVNWSLLAYLFGMTIVIRGFNDTRITDIFWRHLLPSIRRSPTARQPTFLGALIFVTMVIVLSILVTSIPAVLLLLPKMHDLQNDKCIIDMKQSQNIWYLILAWSVTVRESM
jgi:Na+/H+ antiporter NhaD/arsenite permease-like protein